MLYNTAKIYSNQIKKGDKYIELQPVYGLAILDDIFDRETDDYYHLFIMQNPKNQRESISGMNIVFIELPKFFPQSKDEKELTVLWLRFLKEIDDGTSHVSPELAANPAISEAIEICEVAAYTDEEMAAYDKYWDTVSYERTLLHGKLSEGMEKGRAEGLQEGIEKGRAERDIEFVFNLYKKGIGIEQIADLTNLPIETVKEILTQK
ncbi:MAG: Rpn family recombination-promoting nuclease/putative transposase, partial [Prevotellaceae bacterium]|jgi:predicted transposase/invertase (TIGR01784 family)|nr:Rpn family recombination-promoting nuclease/putative transposase [Prevotellaceae bacterium]